MKTKFFFLLSLFLIFATACSSQAVVAPRQARLATVIYVKKAPPKPKYEKARRCRLHHIWIKGHWQWNGRTYIWVKGHCIKKHHADIWVPGHWKHTSYGWFWVSGHWR